jgi:hypothetical protein
MDGISVGILAGDDCGRLPAIQAKVNSIEVAKKVKGFTNLIILFPGKDQFSMQKFGTIICIIVQVRRSAMGRCHREISNALNGQGR